jgi:hypothetical protein
MIKSRLRSLVAIVMLLGPAIGACAEDRPLQRSTPEAEGIPSQAIVDFIQAADKNVNTFDSFMIVRHGKVIAEGWWKAASFSRASRDTRFGPIQAGHCRNDYPRTISIS